MEILFTVNTIILVSKLGKRRRTTCITLTKEYQRQDFILLRNEIFFEFIHCLNAMKTALLWWQRFNKVVLNCNRSNCSHTIVIVCNNNCNAMAISNCSYKKKDIPTINRHFIFPCECQSANHHTSKQTNDIVRKPSEQLPTTFHNTSNISQIMLSTMMLIAVEMQKNVK